MATPELLTSTDLAEAPQWTPVYSRAIASAEDYTEVAERLKTIKAYQAKVREFFSPFKRRAHEMHKFVCDTESAHLKPALEQEQRDKLALIAYDEQQEKLRREEEARLAELARQDEQRRRLEEAAAIEREAQRTGNRALLEEAAAVLDEPLPVPTVVLPSTTPKVVGISKTTYVYTARVTNFDALFAWVATNPMMRRLLEPNQAALDAQAAALREHFAIPGCELVKTPRLAVRR